MVDADTKDLAEAADLLASAEGEKEVIIRGKTVKIKKVNVGELADILKVSRDNELEQYIWLVYKGVVTPKLTVDQVRKMQHSVLLELALEIQKYSELDRESMTKLENLLKAKS